MRRLLVIGWGFLVVSAQICAAEWLQWGGPNGDYTVHVKGLAEVWPEAGPPRLWQRPFPDHGDADTTSLDLTTFAA